MCINHFVVSFSTYNITVPTMQFPFKPQIHDSLYGNIEHIGNYIKIDVHCVTLLRKNSDKTRHIRFIIILSNNQKLKSFQDSMIDKNVAQVQWVMP